MRPVANLHRLAPAEPISRQCRQPPLGYRHGHCDQHLVDRRRRHRGATK